MSKSNAKSQSDRVTETTETRDETTQTLDDSIRGRAVFASEITATGVAVSTVFLADDGRLFPMPAVFPNLQYALEQIDDLRQMVTNHFSQAAQVGAQVIAAEMAARAASSTVSGSPNLSGDPVDAGVPSSHTIQ